MPISIIYTEDDQHPGTGAILGKKKLNASFSIETNRHMSNPVGALRNYDTIIELAASEYELDYIRTHFSNIPMTDGKSVIWTDPHIIRFITVNLSLLGCR